MKSYLEQLTIQSENQKVSLRDAFNWAGLSKTTYYRQLKGTELRYETAIKIERAIDQLATLQKKIRESTKEHGRSVMLVVSRLNTL